MQFVLIVTLCLVGVVLVALAASNRQQKSLLNSLDESTVERFLSSPDAVKEFVDCFQRPLACPNKRLLGFLGDLPPSISLSGRCVDCTPEQYPRCPNFPLLSPSGDLPRSISLSGRCVDCTPEQYPRCPNFPLQSPSGDLPRSISLSGRCVDCTPEQYAHLKKVLGKAITGLQQRHRREWNRLLTYVADYIQ